MKRENLIPWYMDPENPNSGMSIGLSLCCAAKMQTVPPCLGDSTLYLCSECRNLTMPIFVQLWEKVGKGTHRKIVYDKKKMIATMNWIKLEKGTYPDFDKKVIVAQFFENDAEPVIGVGKLTKIDKDGFIFEGGDSTVFNNTYRGNKQIELFIPTHFCEITKP